MAEKKKNKKVLPTKSEKKAEKKVKYIPPCSLKFRCNVCGTVSDNKSCCGQQDYTQQIV